MPEITVTALAVLTSWESGNRGPSERGPEGSIDLVDNVSYLRGKHAFKFGFEYVEALFDGNPTDQAEGQIKFKLRGSNSSRVIPNERNNCRW